MTLKQPTSDLDDLAGDLEAAETSDLDDLAGDLEAAETVEDLEADLSSGQV